VAGLCAVNNPPGPHACLCVASSCRTGPWTIAHHLLLGVIDRYEEDDPDTAGLEGLSVRVRASLPPRCRFCTDLCLLRKQPLLLIKVEAEGALCTWSGGRIEHQALAAGPRGARADDPTLS